MQGVIGAFSELDSAVHAIEDLRKQNFSDLTVYTPTPRHELEHALQPPQSPVRRFTLIGGLLGGALYKFGVGRFMPAADEPAEEGRIPAENPTAERLAENAAHTSTTPTDRA